MKKVSIVVPVYNSNKYIRKCIESLIDQSYKNIEILLINDGSTDNSDEICKEYKSKDKRIIYVVKEHTGVSDTRNKGIEIATGEYIVFIDSDDFIDNDAIEKLEKNHNKNNLTGLKINRRNYKDIYNKNELLTEIMQNKILGSCCGYLFLKSNIINLRFDVNTYYMEDTLFLINYLKFIERVEFIGDAKYYYTANKESITNIISIERSKNNLISILYSLNKINEIIKKDNTYNNFTEIIENKKVKLLESELIKFKSINEIKKFIENKDIINILNLCDYKKLNQFSKFIYYIIIKRKKYSIYVYNKLRRIVKYLKNIIERNY